MAEDVASRSRGIRKQEIPRERLVDLGFFRDYERKILLIIIVMIVIVMFFISSLGSGYISCDIYARDLYLSRQVSNFDLSEPTTFNDAHHATV